MHINVSLQNELYAENKENFVFHIIYIFLVQYGVWSCQVVIIFV